MTNNEFVEKAICITKIKTLYVMGCFGAPLNEQNKKRYLKNHSYNTSTVRANKIKKATGNTFGFDCVCLIKGILWGFNGDSSKMYGGAVYCRDCIPDFSISTLRNISSVSNDMSTIEKGEVLFMASHVGIYAGDGNVVECTPAWKDGVQLTKLSARKWECHGKIPYIDYEESNENIVYDIDVLAKEVIQGKWGNGAERVSRLSSAGYNYRDIQNRVNQILGGD